MEIEGAIIGRHALDLDKQIILTNFACLDINHLVLNFAQTSMIDSIGLEAINHAQEKGLRISILNPQGLVRDILDWASSTNKLSPFLQIVENDRRTSMRPGPGLLPDAPACL
jgi:anti-anti-sigma regulatory factor